MKTFTHFAKGLRITLPAALLLLATSATVWGNTLTQFALNGNNAVCGCSENVEADFTALANGDLQVVLTNSIDTYVDRQILTGIQFRFAGSGNSAGTVTSQTPDGNTLYNITNSTGVLTRTSASLTAWSTQLDLSPYVTLTNLGVSGVHGGGEGILGSATSGAVNNLSQHDPLVLGAATFLLHGIAGVDASTISPESISISAPRSTIMSPAPLSTASQHPVSTPRVPLLNPAQPHCSPVACSCSPRAVCVAAGPDRSGIESAVASALRYSHFDGTPRRQSRV